MMIRFKLRIKSILFVLFFSIFVYGQHRGDNLSFQGIDYINSEATRAISMRNALTSSSGDINAIYFNPAGLLGIEKFEFMVGGNTYSYVWRENQKYRPNRQFATLSFYLDGLYIPDPQNNNKWDYEVFREDTNYYVEDPKIGLDDYSKEAADWQKDQTGSLLNNFVLAIPINFSNQKIVLSASYNKQLLLDYDRNQTYLNPHISTTEYGELPPRVTGEQDSVHMDWYDFERKRDGKINFINLAFAFSVLKKFNLGIGINYLFGKTDDYQRLSKIGYFDLMGGYNKFKFSYDTSEVGISGESKYSGLSFNFGVLYELEKINLGFTLWLPYTINREWSYRKYINNHTSNVKGTDKLKIDYAYAVGITFKPVSNLKFRLDLKKNNYASSKFTFTEIDTTYRSWVNQLIFGAGFEYRIWNWLQLNGGYESFGEVFVPDGNGITNSGPKSTVLSLGFSMFALSGRFDIVYRKKILKYFDAYYSNTNFSFFQRDYLLFSYSFKL